jgi:hypothetical protein
MSIDVEYAIKKDIRNNPVVREIDREQKRDFLRTIGIWTLIVAMLLFSAMQSFKNVRHGMEVDRLRHALSEARETQRKLQLDLEVWLSPQELEARAIRELGMEPALSKDTIVIERATTSQPSHAVVASANPGGAR